MKQQRSKFKLLALIMFGMFLLLAVYGGYSVFAYGNRWFASSRNPRVRAQKEKVIAGDILDRNAVTLATTSDGERVYQSDADARSAIVHLLGDSQGQVSNGVETFQTSYLYGFQTSLPELVASLFRGDTRRGDNVTLTIDSRLCTAITQYFDSVSTTKGKRGAAVVMNYKTGEVVAEISLPNFDPANITEELMSDAGQPFWNRATQSVYAPGSTFKIITTAAALQNLPNVQDTTFTCNGALQVDGENIIYDYDKSVHNSLTLSRAFLRSCNNVFAQLALQVGDGALRKTAESFGFNDEFLFRDLVVENSSYPTTNRSNFEIATSGIGQSAIVASPTHMCMIAAAIANDGVMMEPRILREVNSFSGVTRTTFQPNVYRTAIDAAYTETIKAYMAAVVQSGTGKRAAVDGLSICGKTGSADSSLDGMDVTHGWFVGFINDDDLPFAVSVIVESIDDGESGGTTAAPIAGQIFAYLKAHPDRVLDASAE